MAPPKGKPKYARPVFNARFWQRVTIGGPDDCWPWHGAVGSDGYGQVTYNSKRYGAHRFAYACNHGDDSIVGVDVLHSCDNPLCCNDRHHFLGNQTDNNKDRDSKGRNARGERHGKAKLSAADVAEIRRLGRIRFLSKRAVARKFGMASSGICRIINGELWKDDTN